VKTRAFPLAAHDTDIGGSALEPIVGLSFMAAISSAQYGSDRQLPNI
jgi:hypothetical protein